MSNKRPNCLKPMLKKAEFAAFAQSINEAVAWNPCGSEMFIFYLTSFIIPPISGLIMVHSISISLLSVYSFPVLSSLCFSSFFIPFSSLVSVLLMSVSSS
jgi:cellulose synthase/poly-beta-1,6-N-acetylglucosamine synthase-like glycosyltransferase